MQKIALMLLTSNITASGIILQAIGSVQQRDSEWELSDTFDNFLVMKPAERSF